MREELTLPTLKLFSLPFLKILKPALTADTTAKPFTDKNLTALKTERQPVTSVLQESG